MKLSLSLIMLALLVACSPGGADGPFEVYLARVGNTLDIDPGQPLLPAPVPRTPRTGQLRIPIAGSNLEALDFLDLRGCDLQVTVGKRNSSLGKLASDSQRLLLELEFLRLAPACADILREQDKDALAEQLDRAWHHKRSQLPALIFNATLANEEYRQFWRPEPLDEQYPANTSSAVVIALETVAALAKGWLAGQFEVDNMEFELLLSDIATGDGGTLWRALGHQAAWLEEVDRLAEQRLASGPLCAPTRRPEAADILPNVIRLFFVDGIQPRSAQLGQRYYQLLPPVQALESLLSDTLPTHYRQWQTDRNGALSRYSEAPALHVQTLQRLLESCGGIGGNP